MKIYISGKITGVDDYLEKFGRAETVLKENGFIVVNPAKVMAELPNDTPRGCYMDLSIDMLKYCDAIYMLRGWEYSEGPNEERDYAVKHNKYIVYEAEGDDVLWGIGKLNLPSSNV